MKKRSSKDFRGAGSSDGGWGQRRGHGEQCGGWATEELAAVLSSLSLTTGHKARPGPPRSLEHRRGQAMVRSAQGEMPTSALFASQIPFSAAWGL